jgi:hypothetical protein
VGARSELDDEHDRLHAPRLADARARARRGTALHDELRATNELLRGFDQTRAQARANGHPGPWPSEDERKLLASRERLQAELASPALRGADRLARDADANLERGGEAFTAADRAAWRARRRADIDAALPVDHERNLRAAGIDPLEYRRAEPATQAELRERSQRAIDRHRQLIAALGEPNREEPGAVVAPAELRVDPRMLRERRRAERGQIRAEQRLRHRRARVYRRR